MNAFETIEYKGLGAFFWEKKIQESEKMVFLRTGGFSKGEK